MSARLQRCPHFCLSVWLSYYSLSLRRFLVYFQTFKFCPGDRSFTMNWIDDVIPARLQWSDVSLALSHLNLILDGTSAMTKTVSLDHIDLRENPPHAAQAPLTVWFRDSLSLSAIKTKRRRSPRHWRYKHPIGIYNIHIDYIVGTHFSHNRVCETYTS